MFFEIPIEVFQFDVKFFGNVPDQVTARLFITDKGYLGNKLFDQFGFLNWIFVNGLLNHFDAEGNDILQIVFNESFEGFCAMFQDIRIRVIAIGQYNQVNIEAHLQGDFDIGNAGLYPGRIAIINDRQAICERLYHLCLILAQGGS